MDVLDLKVGGRERFFSRVDIRLPDVLLPVLEVRPESAHIQPSLISLGAHEGECWLEDRVRERFVLITHGLP